MGCGGWEINQRASGDASTCSLLEQRPGGSGGILISSGDMFLTFSENKAARDTENTMVRLLVSTRAAFPSPRRPASPRTSGQLGSARWSHVVHFDDV